MEQLQYEGKMSLENPNRFYKQFPGKQKYTVARLAGLEGLRKLLQSKKLCGAEQKPFEKEADILLYSWKLFKDKMDQSTTLLYEEFNA